MNKISRLLDIIKEAGFETYIDAFGNYSFMFELKIVRVSYDEPNNMATLRLIGFAPIREEKFTDPNAPYYICNALNQERDQIKVYIKEENGEKEMFADYQFLYTDKRTATFNLERALDIFSTLMSSYISEKAQYT